MKRELVHPGCRFTPTPHSDPAIAEIIEASGEETKHVFGMLRSDCQCDHCGEHMSKDDEVVAQSTFTRDNPWFEWEGACIYFDLENDCVFTPPSPPEGE